jgi:AraC-like DNA-binding protein
MDKITKELKVSGIYCIENITNHKTYIGSSKNIYQRLLKHFALLRHNKHQNAHLQSAWNKYGESSFRWFILELCDSVELTEKEQYCIDLFGAEYNITRIIERNILSRESRIKQGETRRRLHQEGKLEWNFNPVTLYVYDLEGKLLFSNPLGLKDTARRLGISPSSICRVTNGTYQQCKGYRFSYKLETLLPLNIKSIQQNTKYQNYMQCRVTE